MHVFFCFFCRDLLVTNFRWQLLRPLAAYAARNDQIFGNNLRAEPYLNICGIPLREICYVLCQQSKLYFYDSFNSIVSRINDYFQHSLPANAGKKMRIDRFIQNDKQQSIRPVSHHSLTHPLISRNSTTDSHASCTMKLNDRKKNINKMQINLR